MAKYTEAKCRICRREGCKLFLKGDRCFTDKCAYDRRPYAPGQHGRARKKVSEYAVQLREKQKTRRSYGILEKQFRGYFEKAEMQKGVTGTNLLVILERRLDNVVYRLGFANRCAWAIPSKCPKRTARSPFWPKPRKSSPVAAAPPGWKPTAPLSRAP